ncbi:MAG: glycosyltransferase family 2 protein [Halobacteriota archaeon]|nr:glycosyltransferase family 2 protein [Halobacteriota archaeon]
MFDLKIIVAMPAFNEEAFIAEMVIGAKKHSDEVIVIDDGSVDRTSEIAEENGAYVIKHQKNLGKGAAIQTIMGEVRKRDADVLILMDADGQHNPDEIPRLVNSLNGGDIDLVIGTRFMEKNCIPTYRKFGLMVMNFSTRIASGSDVVDSQSGFRALSRNALNLLTLFEYGFAIESEMIVDAAKKGLKMKETPISCRYDVDGSTLDPLTHGFKVMTGIMKVILAQF